MTKQDLLDVLGNHPKAPEAIFWWCVAWHSGVGSDLYTTLCDETLGYTPNPKDNVTMQGVNPATGKTEDRTVPRWYVDPEIHECFNKLEAACGPMVQYEYLPVKLADVREGHVLIAGARHACLTDKWPCRVFRSHGALGVTCSERFHGIHLLPGSEPYFHPLIEDKNGFVAGFRR